MPDPNDRNTWESGAAAVQDGQQRPRLNTLVIASAVLHVAPLAAIVSVPDCWPWALGVFVVNHLALVGAGLWPHSRLLGPNITHLPAAAAARREIALTFDDGPDPEVTPAVLDLLEAHGARATFFCIGQKARRHAALCQEIVRRGHALENHSEHHRHTFSLLGPRAYRSELHAAQQTFFSITGRAPRFFRAPAGLRNLFLEPALAEVNLHLVSWTRRGYDTRERDPNKVLKRLRHNLSAGDILLLHDGHSALTRAGQPVILDVLPRLLEDIRTAGLKTVTLHSADIIQGFTRTGD